MKFMKILFGASLLLGALALASAAQSVQSDFDRSADLSKLKTFTFAGEVTSVKGYPSTDLMTDQRIMAALDRKLSMSGYQRDDDGQADFKVTYSVATSKRLNLREYNYGPPRFFGSRDIRLDQYTEGTLLVDIIDTKTKRVVWRGRTAGAVELQNADKKISKSVDKLIEQFVKDVKRGVVQNVTS